MADKRDPEVDVGDAELDALMAQLEQETAGAVSAPTPATPAATPAPATVAEARPDETEEAVVEDDVAAEAEAAAPAPAPAPTAAPELPRGKDPIAGEESNFVLPPHMRQEAAANEGEGAEQKPQELSPGSMASEQAKPADPNVKKAPMFSIDVAAFNRDTAISDTNLDKCMMEQAGLRAYYNEQAARAEAQAERLAANFKVKEAALYDKHRKALEGTGKVTEKMVENAVLLDPAWLKMKHVVIEAESIAKINRGLVMSLADRKDMLVQLGADRREEGKGQLRVMDKNALEDRARNAMRGGAC